MPQPLLWQEVYKPCSHSHNLFPPSYDDSSPDVSSLKVLTIVPHNINKLWHEKPLQCRKYDDNLSVFTNNQFRQYLLHHAPGYTLQTFKAQWLLYVPPGRTFINSIFCPQSISACFVWIWQQIAITSPYNTICLVFTPKMEGIQHAVWTESSITTQVSL
jgi:hypothetical protein